MRFNLKSKWDERYFHYNPTFVLEIDRLDKAHKRAKKELRKQQKAITKKNLYLEYYKRMLRTSQKKRRELELINEALLNELARLKSE